jgi:hypothetical protein
MVALSSRKPVTKPNILYPVELHLFGGPFNRVGYDPNGGLLLFLTAREATILVAGIESAGSTGRAISVSL